MGHHGVGSLDSASELRLGFAPIDCYPALMEELEGARRAPLSWALMICTYSRPDMLLRCVRLALRQTRPPREIVIVDASTEWEPSAASVRNLVEELGPEVRLVYEPAVVRSTTHQRNQALRNVTADVSFAIDDDSLMTLDCAAAVMEVYESDPNGRIAGVGIIPTPHPPDEKHAPSSAPTPANSGANEPRSWLSGIQAKLARLLDMERQFVPYLASDSLEVGELEVGGHRYTTTRVLNGFRTTFRSDLGRQVGWSEALLFYALHEDADFTYRLSRLASIVIAPRGRVCHCQAPGGRLSRRTVDQLRVLNLAALHRIHSPDIESSRRRIAATYLRTAALFLLVDPLRKRLSFPTVRAYLAGIAKARKILASSESDFAAGFQAQVKGLVAAE